MCVSCFDLEDRVGDTPGTGALASHRPGIGTCQTSQKVLVPPRTKQCAVSRRRFVRFTGRRYVCACVRSNGLKR